MLYERGLTLCPYSIRHIIRMCLLGNYPIASGRESNRFSQSRSRGFVGVASSESMSAGDLQPTLDKSWLAFFMFCAPAASGMRLPENLPVARPYTVTFSTGHERVYLDECGKLACKSMMKSK